MNKNKWNPGKIAFPVLCGLLVAALAFAGRGILAETAPLLIPLKDISDTVEDRVKTFPSQSGSVTKIAFSPDGKTLACVMGREVFILYDPRSFGIKRKFKKNPFETTKEYEARIRLVEVPYSIGIALRKEQYNADQGGFEIEFKGNKLFVPVERERAKELVNAEKGRLKLVGKLKYHDPENLGFTETYLVDSADKERYAVSKSKE